MATHLPPGLQDMATLAAAHALRELNTDQMTEAPATDVPDRIAETLTRQMAAVFQRDLETQLEARKRQAR
ncbi:hypothetical protein [Lacticaseibacillus mingshuiensis]|uniref:Uncharacterized protein n=1 Tax=Lacticaseibacillus mingshuiensis TaxID=2799574 RepID=A0ABW4CHA3_9LACO|nr:hypothetical protein [Lacticaseibacillus mingshuiensis]